jgi:hypothetical protein
MIRRPWQSPLGVRGFESSIDPYLFLFFTWPREHRWRPCMHNQHIDHVLALHKEFLNGFLINPADLAVGV